jgi:hypothetical protein
MPEQKMGSAGSQVLPGLAALNGGVCLHCGGSGSGRLPEVRPDMTGGSCRSGLGIQVEGISGIRIVLAPVPAARPLRGDRR